MNLTRALVLSAAVFFLASGCKSSSTPCPSGTTKVDGQCVSESDGLADSSVGNDTNQPDTSVADTVLQDVPTFDTITCDAGYVIQNGECKKAFDNDPPTVTKISVTSGTETNGQYLGVDHSPTFQVDFNEPMQVNSVYGNSASGSLFLTDVLSGNGVEIAQLTFSNNNQTVTFTVKAPLTVATVYRLRVTTAAKDEAGNFLDQEYSLTVITAGPKDTAKYEALARKYAPKILQGVDNTAPKWDLPLALDFDNDWNLKNNDNSATTAATLKPFVYWAVRETTVKAETTKKSHVFITYILYYPLANDATYKMVNHTIGLTVVVEKDSAGKDVRPIAALLHYQQSNEIHQMRVFAVKDANFEPSAAVDKIYDAVSDFFVNGTTFELFVPAKLHAACSWSEKVSGVGESCQQPSTSNGIVELTLADPGVQPNELNTTNLKFDGTDTSTYGLKSFLNEVWPRRVDEGDGKVFNSNGSYTAPPTRPGTGVKRSVTFTGNTSVGNLGRTPMGWREMGNGLGDNDLAGWDGFIGVHFFDPAFLLTARLLTSDEAMLWAVDYCFNAYLAIEDRGNYTDCPTQ